MKKCLNCGTKTHNKKFCSRSCSATYNNTLAPKRALEGSCRSCDTPISSGRTYCTNCYTIDWSKVTKDQMLGRRAYQKHSRIRDLARKAYSKLGRPKSCHICEYKAHIEVCHIKGIGLFPSTAYITEINHPSNLIGLCPNCHWELDHGLLEISDLKLPLT